MRVAVIGGGIVGCAVARELARAGVEVDLFERRAIAGGATQASAGALVPFVEAHDPGPLQDLSVRSLEMYEAFVAAVERESGLQVEFSRPGSIEIAFTHEEAARLRALAGALETRGAEWVDAHGLQTLQPGLAAAAHGGLFVPEHAHVSAAALTDALAIAARGAGARVLSADVTAVSIEPAGVVLEDAAGKACRFDRAVIANGSWVTRLELAGGSVPPVRPVKGQLLHARVSTPVSRILWSPSCYVVPQGGGDVLIGATMEEAGFDESPTDTAAAALLDAFAGLMPGTETRILSQRVGLRPATHDSLPVVGRSSASPRLLYAVGHFRNGVILAPLTAQLVAGLVLGREPDPALGVLSPARFGI